MHPGFGIRGLKWLRGQHVEASAGKARRLAKSCAAAIESLETRVLLAGQVIEVTTTADSGAGSLREAINTANATTGSTIAFDQLAANSVITLASDLPALTASNTTIDGTTAAGGRQTINGGGNNGLTIEAIAAVVHGLWLESCNNAITLGAGSSSALIEGNYIGDVMHAGGLQNTVGINLTNGTNNDVIGGTAAVDRNIISGNATAGVLMQDPSSQGTTSVTVEGNYIGLDPTGSTAAPNNIGVELSDVTGSTVQSNLISGNQTGVLTNDPNNDGGEASNIITANTIGLNVSGSAVPNTTVGIQLNETASSSDTVSDNNVQFNDGPGIDSSSSFVSIQDNIFAHNSGSGVVIESTANHNTISQNTIYANSVLGIDLGNGGNILPNTAGGGRNNAGANGDQPFPVLTTSSTAPTVTVTATLAANPFTNYTIELFVNSPSVASNNGYGQGQTYVTSFNLATDSSGNGSASTTISGTLYAGDALSATATNISSYDQANNKDAFSTSEFAQNVTVPGVPLPTMTIANSSANVGQTMSFPVTLSNASASDVTVDYAFVAGTATTADFQSASGVLTIPAGATTGTITTMIEGDRSGVGEAFTVQLSSVVNALFSDGQTTISATGTIAPGSGTQADSTTLSSSITSLAVNGFVELSATVTPTASGGAVPTGSLVFQSGDTTIGIVALDSSGKASLGVTTLGAGLDSLTAYYTGDATYAVSTSSALLITVSSPSVGSTTQLTASASSIVVGQSVTFTATVASSPTGGATPSGTVSFIENNSLLGTASIKSNGTAVFTTTSLPLGSNSIIANYAGGTTYGSSNSSAVAVNVTAVVPSVISVSVAKATLAASAVGGVKFKSRIPVVLLDSGTAIKGKFTLNLYANTSTSLDGNQKLLLSTVKSLTFRPKHSKTLIFQLKPFNAAFTPGTYYVIAEIVDPTGAANSAATAKTVKVAAPFVSLAANVGAASPSTILTGKTGAVSFVLIDEGNVPASGLLTATLSPSSDGRTPLANTALAVLKVHATIQPGKKKTFHVRFKVSTALAAGAYYPYFSISLGAYSTVSLGTSQFTVS